MSEKNSSPKAQKNQKEQAKESPAIVGIGASAGGLEALQELVSHLPKDPGNIALVVTQHLSPKHKSMLVKLLARETTLRVTEVSNRMKVESGVIYVTPPDREIILIGNYLQLVRPTEEKRPKPSVDVFFNSLAEVLRERAIGVILSGTGSDGAAGMRRIRAVGGVTIAQEPDTAKYDGMPIAAIETGSVDLVLSPDKIGEEIKEIREAPRAVIDAYSEEEEQSTLEQVFTLLSERTGTDFSGYKSSTICRRLDKRLSELSIDSLESYLEHIRSNEDELDKLFDNILIGVTTFFRDTKAFEELQKYLEHIITENAREKQIRIWIPACATGEEPYSIAIILHEILKERIRNYNIQIFATDIDEAAVNKARRGIFGPEAVKDVPEEILEKYFLKRENGEVEVIKKVRQLTLFSKHDVTSNPPFLKLDLISCRNLLIYFDNSLQKHIIPIFHYSLKPEGFLFLGKSETVGQFKDLFGAISPKYKIFKRKTGSKVHPTRFSFFKPHVFDTKLPAVRKRLTTDLRERRIQQMTTNDMVKETLFNSFEQPYVLINDNFDVVEVHGDVRKYLSLQQGVMNSNILKMIHKDVQIDLRSQINKCLKDNLPQKGRIRKLSFFGTDFFVRTVVKPVIYSRNELLLVIFEEFLAEEVGRISSVPASEGEEESPLVLELEHELATTKEHLQTFIEELETANEELQSLNEELQSSNEELQSSNEELETSNEELQSTNEELQIAYTELKQAVEEVERQNERIRVSEANGKALLSNTLQSFILLGKDYSIIALNEIAEEFLGSWSGQSPEPGDSIISFFGEEELTEFHLHFRKAVKGENISGQTLLHINGDKRWFRFNFTPVLDDSGKPQVISYSLLDITQQIKTAQELSEGKQLIDSIFDVANIGICVTNEEGRFERVNEAYCRLYGYEEVELIGSEFTIVLPEEQREFAANLHREFLDGKPETAGEWEVMRKDGTTMIILVTAARINNADGKRFKVTTVTDISARKLMEKELQMTLERLKGSNEKLDKFMNKTTDDIRSPLNSVIGLMNIMESEPDPAQIRNYLKVVKQRLNKMDNLMKSVVNFTRENQNPTFSNRIHFKGLFETSLSACKDLPNFDKVSLSLHVEGRNDFESSPSFIQLIFRNMIAFSLLRCPEEQETLQLELRVTKNNGSAEIRYADNAEAPDTETLKDFEELPYKQLKHLGKSTTELLVISETVQKMNGRVLMRKADTDSEMNTVFEIELAAGG